jgi:hypothetical protein
MNEAFARVSIELESLDLMLDSVLSPPPGPAEHSAITGLAGLAKLPADPLSLAQLRRLAETIEIDLREGQVIRPADSIAPSIVPG